jgi:Ca2+-binding RTX toxin-like protein
MHENDGNDIVQGDAGNDDLFGEESADSMTGGPGIDRFFCSPDGDTITDFNTGCSRDRMSGNCILGSILLLLLLL